MATKPLAVVDIGSNSGRVVVVALSGGHLEVLADARASLRLAAELESGRLSAAAVERAVQALKDFASVAAAAGASRPVVVATSAVRESSNADELVRRAAKATGLKVQILDGEEEARYSFIGAIHGLPVDHGLLVDVGGGSAEIAQFRDRKLMRSWTLPLGALRVSARFLTADPPTAREVRRLCEHVAAALHDAGIPPLASDESLIGTGGTLRTLAKMDRHDRSYVIPRIHGYELTRRRVEDLSELLASRKLSKRAALRGLGEDRADSIVGGALVTATTMQLTAAESLIVSGQGLREGIALDRLAPDPQPASAVRRAAIEALVARFETWRPTRAARRARISSEVLVTLLPDADDELREMLGHAATVLDIGRSVDYYNRSLQAAAIVIASDLAGFSHNQLASIAYIIRKAEDHNAGLKAFAHLLEPDTAVPAVRAATVLSFADAIDRRMTEKETGRVLCSLRGRDLVVRAPVRAGLWTKAQAERVRLDFGRKLRFESSGGAP